MNTFASTYVVGLNSVIEQWIKEDLKQVEIIENFDGLIIFKTNSNNINLPYTNNTFLVLDYKKLQGGGRLMKI